MLRYTLHVYILCNPDQKGFVKGFKRMALSNVPIDRSCHSSKTFSRKGCPLNVEYHA